MRVKTFEIKPTEEYTDITQLVQNYVWDLKNRLGIYSGLCMVYTKHTTACIRLLENETLLRLDMHDFMERLAPSTVLYRHDDIENRDVPPEERRNGFSHLRSMLLNHQEFIIVLDGQLDLGKWQRIFYVECDLGKEDRTFTVCFFEEEATFE